MQYYTMPVHTTAQCITKQHATAHYSTLQHTTARYCTIQHYCAHHHTTALYRIVQHTTATSVSPWTPPCGTVMHTYSNSYAGVCYEMPA
eukprot:2171251-Pyramimonas_sp.AAC.1